jgi:putative component of toxin-antitoxin plasmid stabilization module
VTIRKTSKYKKWIKKLNDSRARARIFVREDEEEEKDGKDNSK